MSEHGEVSFGGAVVRYEVVRSPRRHKTIEITVDKPGLVRVAAPQGTPAEQLEATVLSRAGWIIRHDGAASAALPPRRFVSGESLPYLGRSVNLTVLPTDDEAVVVSFNHWKFDVYSPGSLRDAGRREKIRAAFEEWYRDRAGLKLPPRVDRIAGLLGVYPKEILIRNQRRRWASCGPDGTLRFNWRIIMAPPSLLDYVVAHELAHLRVRDHTPEYWAVVAQAVPDYRLRRERLREAGPLFNI